MMDNGFCDRVCYWKKNNLERVVEGDVLKFILVFIIYIKFFLSLDFMMFVFYVVKINV